MTLPPKGRQLDVAIVVALLLYIASQSVLASIYHPLGTDSCFRFWLAIDRADVLAVMEQWGEPGIAQFRKHYRLDFIHPLLYGCLLYLLMLRFCQQLPAAPALRLLPVLAAVADLIENLLQLMVLNAGEAVSATTVLLSGSFARSKWALAALCVLIVVAGLLQTLIRALRKPA